MPSRSARTPTSTPSSRSATRKFAALTLASRTISPIFTRTVANREARTVDYHCAWDQGKHLWMIYLMRVVDAQVVFDIYDYIDRDPVPTLHSLACADRPGTTSRKVSAPAHAVTRSIEVGSHTTARSPR